MKLKKLAATLVASFALVACSDDKANDAQADAKQAIESAMGKAQQVQQDAAKSRAERADQKTLFAPAEKTTANTASYSDRAAVLAERLNNTSDPKSDKKLGSDIRSFLADTVKDSGVTTKEFNTLTAKLDAPKATIASGVIFGDNMARNKERCKTTLAQLPNNPMLVAPVISACMNKK